MFFSGDLWCVAAAVSSACFILRLEKFSRENDASELSGVNSFVVTLLCGVWVIFDYLKDRGSVISVSTINAINNIDSVKLGLPPLPNLSIINGINENGLSMNIISDIGSNNNIVNSINNINSIDSVSTLQIPNVLSNQMNLIGSSLSPFFEVRQHRTKRYNSIN